MPYTTEADVIAILADEYDAVIAPTLDAYINTANQLVEEVCVPAGYALSRLAEIEKYLAAYFYAITKPRLESEGVGVIQNKIQSKVDLGFNQNFYGQVALRLDTAGGLAAIETQSTGKTEASKEAQIIYLSDNVDSYGTPYTY